MGILQQPVQAKLSKLIGAEVRFDHLNVSLLGGSVEARGVTVAGDDPAQPVLTVRRVRAEISIPRALKKEFVVKSLTIEGPVLSVVKRADGRTNLPKPTKLENDGDDSAAGGGRGKAADGPADDAAGGSWRLEAQHVLLVDGAVRYHADAPAGGEPLDFAAEGVLAEVKAAGGGLDFTCIVESAGRRGARRAELGQVKFAGRAAGVEDLSQLADARVTANVELGNLLRADVTVPSLKPVAASVSATGAGDLARLAAFLPPSIAARLPSTPADGRVELAVEADYGTGGLHVKELTVRATHVRVKTPPPPPAG